MRSSVPDYLPPRQADTEHTEHSLPESSQLHVGALESFSPAVVQLLLLAVDHDGAAPAKHHLHVNLQQRRLNRRRNG